VLRLPDRWVMIDCGFSLRQTKQRLKVHGLSLEQFKDVVVTHFDRDHFNPVWCKTIRIHKSRVHLHELHVSKALSQGLSQENLVPFKKHFKLGNTKVESIHVAHDALGTMSYIFDNGTQRLGFATDLGRVPDHLISSMTHLDILAFESNYDPAMQLASNRPEFLKERIMGGGGHLSNAQSCMAVKQIAAQSTLQHIVLLHLSRQCNDTKHIFELYQAHLSHLASKVTISHQDRPTGLLSASEQPVESQEVLF